MSATAALLADDPALWARATTAPFLDGVADGTLDADAFHRWLEQDQRFVVALVRAWGRLLTTAPAGDLALLAGGIGAFVDELGWFEGLAATRALALPARALPEALQYEEALQALADRPYPVAITAMWAVEAAYLAAWQGVADRWTAGGRPAAAERYVEHVTHWADEGFAAFVADLAAVVDRELPGGPTRDARQAFRTVAAHEAAFWSMTTDG